MMGQNPNLEYLPYDFSLGDLKLPDHSKIKLDLIAYSKTEETKDYRILDMVSILNFFQFIANTDLGSLIGKFDHGYITAIFYHSDFT